MKFTYQNTFEIQIEILPRLTVLYGRDRGIAFEWLWFSFAVISKATYDKYN